MEPQARQVAISQAESNPNILSALSGAGGSSGIQSPPDTQAAYQQTQQMSTDLAQKLYGGGPAKQIAATSDAQLQELYNFDQQLEQQFAVGSATANGPFPQLPFYVPNAADAYQAGAGYAGQAGQNISKGLSAVQSLEQSYVNAMQGVVSKFMDYFKMAEDKRSRDEDRKFEREKFEYQKERDTSDRSAGSSATERLSSQEQSIKREILAKVAGGAQLRDLLRDYSDRLSPDEIFRLYQSGGSPYGPPVETPEQLRQIGVSADSERGLTPYQETQMKQEGAKRTADYMAQVATYPDRDTAMKEFELYKNIMQNEGVDVDSVQRAIDAKFPPQQGNTFFQNLINTLTPKQPQSRLPIART